MPPTLASFAFALFFLSVASAKTIRLLVNEHSFPLLLFVLYLPTFLLADLFVISIEWLLLRSRATVLAFLGYAFACFLSLITLFAATSQVSFYWHTGGQLNWADATAFALNNEGRKVLMSGSGAATVTAILIIIVAWCLKSILYVWTGVFIESVRDHVLSKVQAVTGRLGFQKTRFTKVPDQEEAVPMRNYTSDDSDSDSSDEETEQDTEMAETGLSRARRRRLSSATGPVFGRHKRGMGWMGCFTWVTALVSFAAFLASVLVFDPELPYGRVLTTLPFPLLDIIKLKAEVECPSGTWPLPELIAESNWEQPKGDFKGWAPGRENSYVERYKKLSPDWLPKELPGGFERWNQEERKKASATVPHMTASASNNPAIPTSTASEHRCPAPDVSDPYYNPVNDPIKISNLGGDILKTLKENFESGSVNIKHVALIQMESMREELFPLQQGSNFHELLMNSHTNEETDDANKKFAQLAPNAERLTGKSGNFQSTSGDAYGSESPEWTNGTAEDGFGGINIVGAHTSSTVSTKSTAAIHCGTWPLPVNMFEESELDIYQPCITQIMDLFNNMKSNSTAGDYREHKWRTGFFQSVTTSYDRQNKFNKKIDFHQRVNKDTIKHDHPSMTEINYFGYAETALEEYVDAFIKDIKKNKQRMLLSHFTSTTHHPWNTPKGFETVDYMGSAGGGVADAHKDMNKFLNTIRWNDAWLGKLMQMFADNGIADETLVILVGDHGQAFKEDAPKTGTYQNSHVSNFRVPITFYHPRIPRVQHEARTTSVGILPTVLDLLVATESLNGRDAAAASDLLHDYEGQSLIRPYIPTHRGRRAWNFGLVNPGGEMLTVTSADAPWRLVMPLDDKSEFVFTNIDEDPLELHRIMSWSYSSLRSSARKKHGDIAVQWMNEARAVAEWNIVERKRVWHYEED